MGKNHKHYRVRYWVQDTVESGHWELTGVVHEATAKKLIEAWGPEHKRPELLEAEEYEH